VAQPQQAGGDLHVHPRHAGKRVGAHRAEHGDAQAAHTIASVAAFR
jgi:hypothetical protein